MTPTKTFRITWRDPETDEVKVVEKEFAGNMRFLPRYWAEDWAYAQADKGWYKIEEVKP